MSKKTSGLGRGLGDLLEDNAPELKSASVVRRGEDGEVSVSPIALSYVKEESKDAEKPLVFPSVTPIIGGESREVSDPGEPSGTAGDIGGGENADTDAKKVEVVGEPPRTRSLKAVFRSFK